jgi:hypothetical protein
LIHAYASVDDRVVWGAWLTKTGPLKAAVRGLLGQDEI